jgi:hypothetical protein
MCWSVLWSLDWRDEWCILTTFCPWLFKLHSVWLHVLYPQPGNQHIHADPLHTFGLRYISQLSWHCCPWFVCHQRLAHSEPKFPFYTVTADLTHCSLRYPLPCSHSLQRLPSCCCMQQTAESICNCWAAHHTADVDAYWPSLAMQSLAINNTLRTLILIYWQQLENKLCLSLGFPWQKWHSTRRRLFSPAKCT